VKFVGTATIGTDHLDRAYLDKRGIPWCSAAGCNANSVSEYFTAALLCLAERHGFSLEGKTLGVIGVGNVGSRIVQKARAIGMQVLPNDPPRQRAGETPEGSGRGSSENDNPAGACTAVNPFFSLDEVLARSDVLTCHVPLTRKGPDATYHLADEALFAQLKPGVVFLNSARGAVVDTDALLRAIAGHGIAHTVIDTWEGEPNYRTDLLSRVDIGTPHIAGHSFEGKYIGTLMVYREACRFLGVEPTWTPDALLPPPTVPELAIDAAGRSDEAVLRELVRAVYDIEADDRRFRNTSLMAKVERTEQFDHLRKNYPIRREFRFTRVILRNGTPGLLGKVKGLGFQCDTPDA